MHPVCTKNEHTGKSQSDAVCTKNEHILINIINETDKETINDTSSGAVQRTDEKQKEILGDFLKKIPPDPLKTFHCVQRAKNAVAFFALHKGSSALSVNQRSRLSGR